MSVRSLLLWAPVAIYMAAIFFVSADPAPPIPASVSDKTLHLLAYFGLSALVCRAVARGIPARITWRSAAVTLLITIGYGASDELHQVFVPNRSPDVKDLLADAAGAVLALIACWAWGIIRTSNSRLPTSNPPS